MNSVLLNMHQQFSCQGETNTVENKPDSSTFSHRSSTAIRTELNAFAENFSVEFCEGDEVCSNDPYKQILFFLISFSLQNAPVVQFELKQIILKNCVLGGHFNDSNHFFFLH